MPELNELTFYQFYSSIWPGIILSLMGLFLVGYYSKRKSIQALCASFFPLIFYSYSYYFSTLSTPDTGTVKAMFEVFHQVGINSEIIHYFQYPTYFCLNETSSQILGLDVYAISILFFSLYGLLLGLFLYLFLYRITKNIPDKVAFFAIPLYFIGMFAFLNYQWAPQTIALVFLFLLMILYDREGFKYKFLSIIVFTTLAFTHAFIPIIFLLFLGIYVLKKKELRNIFLLLVCIYTTILVYYTTYYLPVIVERFMSTLDNLGGAYTLKVAGSLRGPGDSLSQIISLINRVRIPIVWLVVSIGFLIEFIKKRLSFAIVVLGIASGVYLGFGLFYDVLGMRALQILFASLIIGIGFYLFRSEKLTVAIIAVLILSSVFGPMRSAYDQTQFQLDEEETACGFLASTLPSGENKKVLIAQVNWGYFTIIHKYLSGVIPAAYRPGHPKFSLFFNTSLQEDICILWNSNLGKEIISHETEINEAYKLTQTKLLNNKLYECGKTLIITG